MTEDASKALAIEIFQFLAPKADLDTQTILAAVSMVLAAIAVEAGVEEEKAMYAFRKSYGKAERRLKQVLKDIH
jgi:hypothetical protein